MWQNILAHFFLNHSVYKWTRIASVSAAVVTQQLYHVILWSVHSGFQTNISGNDRYIMWHWHSLENRKFQCDSHWVSIRSSAYIRLVLAYADGAFGLSRPIAHKYLSVLRTTRPHLPKWTRCQGLGLDLVYADDTQLYFHKRWGTTPSFHWMHCSDWDLDDSKPAKNEHW